MAGHPFPVLWLCGPGGVGKSTVSWQLFTELADAGVRVAFADTDQVCMCYPAPPGDPGRERIKAQNVGAMITNYRAAGAQCLVANGVVDPRLGLPADLLPQAAVTACRLRADGDEVERRYLGRHGRGPDLAADLQLIRDEVAAMDDSAFADVCVDTSGVPASEVAALVRAACARWPGFSGALPRPAGPAGPARPAGPDEPDEPPGERDYLDPAGTVLLITGPTGVGKSTIGFKYYVDCVSAGLTAGYVDLDQIGFLRPHAPGDRMGHRLKARNLAAIWRTYRAAGATHLVATGPIENDAALRHYAAQLPGAAITVCRLTAGPEELTRRVMSRGAGGSWPQPGDPLRGQPAGVLRAVARQAARQAAAFRRCGPAGVTVDTDGRTPAEAASMIARLAGCAGP